MEMPTASARTVAEFEALRPKGANIVTKQVFGHPAAFVRGHMFFGVFGDRLFLRLSPADREAADRIPGFGVFEPMPGRAMQEYRVIPPSLRAHPARVRPWVTRSLEHAAALPAKPPSKKRTR
jgi:TfoX/Sxy family transcriptional regulator of competence genes